MNRLLVSVICSDMVRGGVGKEGSGRRNKICARWNYSAIEQLLVLSSEINTTLSTRGTMIRCGRVGQQLAVPFVGWAEKSVGNPAQYTGRRARKHYKQIRYEQVTTTDLKFLKCPVEGKHVASEYVEIRQNVETYCEGDTETLSAFLSPFKLFRVDRLLWRSSLPPRSPIAAIRICFCAETFGPFLQLRLVLENKISTWPKFELGSCTHLEVASQTSQL